jgi:hypothetical protein
VTVLNTVYSSPNLSPKSFLPSAPPKLGLSSAKIFYFIFMLLLHGTNNPVSQKQMC